MCYARIFWRYNRPLKGGISSLLYIRKLLVLLLRLSLNSCSYLQNICGLRHGNLLSGVKQVQHLAKH